jgi:membrane protease subunit HflC
VILANAFKDAETIRGEGDAQATEIYASAYGKNSEFYSFYRSLNAYQNSFQGNNDILLLQPDSDFFKYFRGQQGK